MSINYEALTNDPRLLMEAELKPLQGHRFQPTGFPDLGPARYTAPDGADMLLVESPQSVANRMEMACWDNEKQDLIKELQGLPYIKVFNADDKNITNSILEAHRINSEYILKKDGSKRILSRDENKNTILSKESFNSEFSNIIKYKKDGQVEWKEFQKALFRYDSNCLIHGAFLEEIGGRLRITRALSGFIEATNINVAESGGVKNNIVQPELKKGEGNVPFHRTEFTAQKITAYFNLDLALLRSYGLEENATNLLIVLALFKIRRFLSTGLRLRTACDLEACDLVITRPGNDFSIPDENELLQECESLIGKCKKYFAEPAITEVKWEK
ncbi:MAG: type I-G CRISPR-associated RAMP protein Csb1/Cas7g [Candidatus Hinthialibacter sp.]